MVTRGFDSTTMRRKFDLSSVVLGKLHQDDPTEITCLVFYRKPLLKYDLTDTDNAETVAESDHI
jgi:hypothetical protein